MKIMFWLIVVMDVTLMALLWLYIFDLYVRAPFDGLRYTGRIYHSDAAIPIIGLGVLLNTAAIFFLIREVRRSRWEGAAPRPPTLPIERLDSISREAQIDDLEHELGHIIGRLEELKSPSEKEGGS